MFEVSIFLLHRRLDGTFSSIFRARGSRQYVNSRHHTMHDTDTLRHSWTLVGTVGYKYVSCVYLSRDQERLKVPPPLWMLSCVSGIPDDVPVQKTSVDLYNTHRVRAGETLETEPEPVELPADPVSLFLPTYPPTYYYKTIV